MKNVLKETREDKGMTISELAKRSGVSRQTIYNIETNPNAAVSSVVMEAVSDALGVKASKIFLI